MNIPNEEYQNLLKMGIRFVGVLDGIGNIKIFHIKYILAAGEFDLLLNRAEFEAMRKKARLSYE